MNLKDARKIFNSEIAPNVVAHYGKKDKCAMDEAWGVWIDGLCKEGEITDKQYHTWTRT